MSAPYNPDTIAAIRVQARRKISAQTIARLLAWDLQQLLRVAKKHDIGLVVVNGERSVLAPAPKPETPTITPSVITAPAAPPKIFPEHKHALAMARDRDEIDWDAKSRIVRFRGAETHLTKTQLRIFATLVRADTSIIGPDVLSESANVPRHLLKVHLAFLRRKLRPLKLEITSGRFRKGHRLLVLK